MLRKLRTRLLYLLPLLMLTNCGSTRELAIGIVEPAPVQLPHAVKRIGVIKSVPALVKADGATTGIDRLVSRDDELLNQKGIDAALDGLLAELLQDPRFDTILKLSEEKQLIQLKDGQPTDKSWKDIQLFCERNGLDAVFSLDYYNANTRITLKKAKLYERDLVRATVAKKGHQLTLETLIANGWKIYDPFQKRVLDEFAYEEQITTSATGISPLRAYQNMGTLQDSLVIKSRGSGSAYGSRLQPFEKTIYRSYYSKGTDGFIAAHNKIIGEDWSGAIAIWEKELNVNKNKLKAMACHNLAVVYEYLQKLDQAALWASKAYEYHQSKKSLNYINALEERISQNEQIQAQISLAGR